MSLSELGNIPFDISVLRSLYPNISSIHNKASDLEREKTIIRLKRGMYVVSPNVSGTLLSKELISNHLYGPSYVSMETALRFYGLIPESVFSTKSLTIKQSRTFENGLGKFQYINCSKEYFPVGIAQQTMGKATFMIAIPEKALCDMLIHTPNLNLRFQKEMLTYLEQDMRFDMEAFYKMDVSVFEQLSSVGRKRSLVNNIIKILSR